MAKDTPTAAAPAPSAAKPKGNLNVIVQGQLEKAAKAVNLSREVALIL